MKKENLLVIVVGILAFGIGMYLLLFYSKNQAKLIERCTEQTQGIITNVEIETATGEDDTDDIYVTVEYSAGDENYEVTKQSSKLYKEKDSLTVTYNPDDPSENFIPDVDDGVKTLRIGGIIFTIFGIIGLLGGIFKRW